MAPQADHSLRNRRIRKNILLLYGRSLVTLVIALYTSRLVLEALGEDDFGVYNLVGGVVGMFSLFSATFVAATQRCLNVEMSTGTPESLRRTFSASVNLQLGLGAFVLVLAETIGLWALNTRLNIPQATMPAANWVFQFTIITFLVNLTSIPYNAAVIAHERMGVFAFLSIYEAVAKLGVALLIIHAPAGRLSLYAALMMAIAISVRVFYEVYCRRHFAESRYMRVKGREAYRQLLTISGWNFVGSATSIVTVQGAIIIINIFTNVAVNAAKGLASQVENVIRTLMNNFIIALNPQIIQSYAAGESTYMCSLVNRGSRYSVYLMLALCMPIIFQAPAILTMWLGDVPQYTSGFVRMLSIYVMVMPLSSILDTVMLASGRLRTVQISTALIELMNLPLSCLILWAGYAPYLIYVSYIVLSYVALGVRLRCAVANSALTAGYYLRRIVLPIAIVMVIALPVPIAMQYFVLPAHSFINLLLMTLVIEASLAGAIWLAGVTPDERIWLRGRIAQILHPSTSNAITD